MTKAVVEEFIQLNKYAEAFNQAKAEVVIAHFCRAV